MIVSGFIFSADPFPWDESSLGSLDPRAAFSTIRKRSEQTSLKFCRGLSCPLSPRSSQKRLLAVATLFARLPVPWSHQTVLRRMFPDATFRSLNSPSVVAAAQRTIESTFRFSPLCTHCAFCSRISRSAAPCACRVLPSLRWPLLCLCDCESSDAASPSSALYSAQFLALFSCGSAIF